MAQTVYTDDFSGSGNLAGSTVGTSALTWSVPSGSATRSGGLAVFAQAPSASPFAVADLGSAYPDLQISTYTGFGGGDALYFRESDASNWWRLRTRTSQSSTSTWDGTYTYGPWTQSAQANYPRGSTGYNALSQYADAGYQYYGDPSTSVHRFQVIWGDPDHNSLTRFDETRTATQNMVTTTVQNRYVLLEKMVAGSLDLVQQWSVAAFGLLRVNLPPVGGIVVYSTDAATVLGTITDTFNNTATKHGFGLGGNNDNYATGSSLDNFSATLPPPAGPPVITSPANNADVDVSVPVVVTMANAGTPNNPQTAGDLRWRPAGASTWTTIVDAFGTGQTYSLDLTGQTAPEPVEIQTNWTDSNSSTASDWSPSAFFTLRARPSVPLFVSPAAGSDVVASDIAVVDFDDTVASTGRQARRVADASGNPDTSTVYQDSLAISAITSGTDQGDYLLTGDGSIHPVGAEHVQARRQTADGGTLWSDWSDRLVQMQLAGPFPPEVTVTVLPADASVRFDIILPAPDVDHVEAVGVDVYRDGVRVQPLIVTDGTASWTDPLPGKASDYVITAFGANGGTSSWGAA